MSDIKPEDVNCSWLLLQIRAYSQILREEKDLLFLENIYAEQTLRLSA